MRTSRFAATVVALLLLAVHLPAAPAPAPADGPKMEGKWQMDRIEVSGMAIPDAIAKGITLEVKGNKFRLSGEVLEQPIEAEFKVDEKAGTIDFTPTNGPEKGMTSLGVYKVTADTLDLCFGAPGVPRPKELKTSADAKTFLWSLKKVK